MPSRREHSNSHHGCQQCKISRKKCDEAQPRCQRCQAKQQHCAYRHLLSAHDPFIGYNGGEKKKHRAGVGPPSPFPSRCQNPLLRSSPEPALNTPILDDHSLIPTRHERNRRLLHHYFTVISTSVASLGPGPENFPHWDSAIKRCFSQYELIEYGVCALSSLHLALLCRDRDASVVYMETALKSQNIGISHLQALLSSRDNLSSPSGLEACLTFSGILTLCSYSSAAGQSVPAPQSGPIVRSPIYVLLQVMSLTRGVAALYWVHTMNNKNKSPRSDDPGEQQYTLKHTLAQRWGEARLRQELIRGMASDGERDLDELATYVQGLPEDERDGSEDECLSATTKVVYLTTISQLRRCIRSHAVSPGVARFVNSFAAIVKPDFITQLERYRPVAQIIAAHYAVCLHAIRKYWWIGNIGRSLVQEVVNDLLISRGRDRQVDPHWHRFLAWPMRETGVSI